MRRDREIAAIGELILRQDQKGGDLLVCIAEKLAVEPPRHRPLTWRERQKVEDALFWARREDKRLKREERKRFVAASVKQALDADRPSMKEQKRIWKQAAAAGTKTKVRFQEKAAL